MRKILKFLLMPALWLVTFFGGQVASADHAIAATPAPTPSLGVNEIIRATVSNAFDSCKIPFGRHEPDRNEVINTVMSSLLSDATSGQLTTTEPPTYFDASYLRLFDLLSTTKTFDPLNTKYDLELTEGMGFSPDAPNLIIAGLVPTDTTRVIVKQNCTTLITTSIKANSGFSFSSAQISAAANADTSLDSKNTMYLVYGTVTAPFDGFNNSSDAGKLYGNLLALNWRLHNDDTTVNYLGAANVLASSIENDSTSTVGLGAQLNAGITVPWITVSTQNSAALKDLVSIDVHSFKTYFWNAHYEQLPRSLNLAVTAQKYVTLDPPQDPIASSHPVRFDDVINGWPNQLCSPGLWKIASTDPAFQATALEMAVRLDSSDPFPDCELSFTLSTGTASFSSTHQPSFTLTSTLKPSVTLTLPTKNSLAVAGKPSVLFLTPPGPGLTIDPSSPTNVLWNLPITITVPSPQHLASVDLTNSHALCKRNDTSESVPLTIQFPGGALSDSTGNTSLHLLLSFDTNGHDGYIPSATSNLTHCSLSGDLTINTSTPAAPTQIQQ